MRLQLAIVAAGVEDSPDVRRRLTPQILNSLIDERLQMQEAERLDIEVTDVQVAGALEQIAQQNSMTRSEEHTSELQSLMRISYAVFCLKNKITQIQRKKTLDKKN